MAFQHTVVFRLVHEGGSAAEADFLDGAVATLTAIPGVADFGVNRHSVPRANLSGSSR